MEIYEILKSIRDGNYNNLKRSLKSCRFEKTGDTSYAIKSKNMWNLVQVHFIQASSQRFQVYMQFFKPYPTEKPKIKEFNLTPGPITIKRAVEETTTWCLESLEKENITGLAKEAEDDWRRRLDKKR